MVHFLRSLSYKEQLTGAQMLTLSFIFLVLAIIAAILGFSAVAVSSAMIFQIVFYACLAVFLVTFIIGLAIKPPKV